MFYGSDFSVDSSGGMASSRASDAMSLAVEQQQKIRELEHHVDRLALLNQALWELLCDRLGMTDADLERLAHEVDMRDGVEDGKITTQPVRCPTCKRISNSKHYKCLYCGQPFERSLFG